MVYIEQTGQQLSQQLSKHKRTVKSADCRLVHEAFFVQSTKDTLNRDTGTLLLIYGDTVHVLSGMS